MRFCHKVGRCRMPFAIALLVLLSMSVWAQADKDGPTADEAANFQINLDCKRGDKWWADGVYYAARLAWSDCLKVLRKRSLDVEPEIATTIRAFILNKQNEIEELGKKRQAELEAEQEADYDAMLRMPPKRLRSGAIPAVLAYFRRTLDNPKSLQLVAWSRPVLRKDPNPFDESRPYYWVVSVRYRARNAFNALILRESTFHIRNERVVATENY